MGLGFRVVGLGFRGFAKAGPSENAGVCEDCAMRSGSV